MKLPSKIEAGSSFPVVTLPSNWNVDLENVVSTCDHEDKDNVHEDGRAIGQEEPGFLTSREPPGLQVGWGLPADEDEGTF